MNTTPQTHHTGDVASGGAATRRAPWRRALAAATLPVLVAAGFAACGDDDDEASEAATEAESAAASGGDIDAFCSTIVEFNAAAMSTELDENSTEDDAVAAGEELAPMFTTITDNAPEDLADTAATLDGTIQALLDGDAGPFNEHATFELYIELLDGAVGECDYNEVEVELVDYGFHVPDTLEAGTYAFTLTNSSEAEEHEMILMRKNDGVTLSAEELLELPEEEALSQAEPVAFGWAGPGETGSALAELTAGDYVMACFIPVGGGEDGPPHFTQGMVHELSVS